MKKITITVFFSLFLLQVHAQKKLADSLYNMVQKLATLETCDKKREALQLLEAYEVIRKTYPAAGIINRDNELKQLSNYIAVQCPVSAPAGGGALTAVPPRPCRTVTIRSVGGGGVSTNKEVSLDAMLWTMLSETQQQQVLDMLEQKDKIVIETGIKPESQQSAKEINFFLKSNNYEIDLYKKVYDKLNSPLNTDFKKEIEKIIKQ